MLRRLVTCAKTPHVVKGNDRRYDSEVPGPNLRVLFIQLPRAKGEIIDLTRQKAEGIFTFSVKYDGMGQHMETLYIPGYEKKERATHKPK